MQKRFHHLYGIFEDKSLVSKLQQVGAIAGEECLLEQWKKMIPRSQSFTYDFF